jgi:rod shape-determining protein MreC
MGGYLSKMASLGDYFELRKENTFLQQEINLLYNECLNRNYYELPNQALSDTSSISVFHYFPARVIDNSTNKQYNYITLNKGEKDSIRPEMGVISKHGIVGIVNSVSENYASVISLLNRKFHTSAKILKNGYYGPLSWKGGSYNKALLNEIPHHVDIEVGDTIVTSGYSDYFPEGLTIGYVESFKLKDGNFYELTVKLSTDFKNLTYVQVIKNDRKEEIQVLEKEAAND